MDKGPRPGGQADFPFDVNWWAFGVFVAVLLAAFMWWCAYGPEFLYQHFRYCAGCRRDAVNCSCPMEILFTPWDELSDEERDDAL